jgi:hypothetical protein
MPAYSNVELPTLDDAAAAIAPRLTEPENP